MSSILAETKARRKTTKFVYFIYVIEKSNSVNECDSKWFFICSLCSKLDANRQVDVSNLAYYCNWRWIFSIIFHTHTKAIVDQLGGWHFLNSKAYIETHFAYAYRSFKSLIFVSDWLSVCFSFLYGSLALDKCCWLIVFLFLYLLLSTIPIVVC